jgi:hypothetical protein
VEKKGKSEGHAAIEANKWLFDYSLLTPSMRYLRNSPIGIPFLTFNMKVLPRLWEVARTDTFRYAPFILLPMAIAELSKQYLDLDDEEWEKLRNDLPNWMREKHNMFIFPFRDEDGKFYPLDFSYFLPFTPWLQVAEDIGQGLATGDVTKMGEIANDFGLFGGPLPSIITAIKGGTDPFTKRKIYEDSDPNNIKLAKILGYTYQMAMPTWLTGMGTFGPFPYPRYGHLWRALGNERDTGSKPEVWTALAKLGGLNFYPTDVRQSRIKNIKYYKSRITGLKRDMSREFKSRIYTDAEKQERLAYYQKRIREYQEELRDYTSISGSKFS